MLSRVTRYVTYAVGALFIALGVVLFAAPGWSADRFPWRVSDFLVMTMGAWYAGTGVYAWMAARSWQWSSVHTLLAYLWLFSLGQTLLLVVHEDVIDTGAALAWPYIAVVGAGAAAALLGLAEVGRLRPRRTRDAGGMPWWMRLLAAAFVVAVSVLALPLVDGYDSPGSIWPGELTLISARAFAVFFGSLALSSALLVVARGLEPMLAYLRAGIVLNVVILVAAAVHLGKFDFGEHPGQLLYLGLYAIVLAGALALLRAGRAQS